MALQQDLQQWSNYPTHFLSIQRQNNICSITHSPSEYLRCVIKSSSLEYMNEFLLDMFSYVRHAQFRLVKVLLRHNIILRARFQMSK